MEETVLRQPRFRIRDSNGLSWPDDMIAHCKGQIARFKEPCHVRIVDSFIMTVTGKAQTIALRKVMEAELWATA